MAKKYYDGGSMIKSDKSQMANLPQQVMIKKYPVSPGYMPENLNDSLSGIDNQMSADNSKKKSNFSSEKY